MMKVKLRAIKNLYMLPSNIFKLEGSFTTEDIIINYPEHYTGYYKEKLT